MKHKMYNKTVRSGSVWDILSIVKDDIEKFVPSDVKITRARFEGPYIAIYTNKPEILIRNSAVISHIASKIKKRIVLRIEDTIRESITVDEADKIIRRLLKAEGIKESELFFDESLGEVMIYIKNHIDSAIIEKLTYDIIINAKRIPRFRFYRGSLPTTLKKIYDLLLPPVKGSSVKSAERLNYLNKLSDRIFREPQISPSKDIRLSVLGGSQEVGRSAILISTAESNILVDFGLKTGVSGRGMYPRIDLFNIDLSELDAVILTHAHLDHSGLIPFLYKHGYNGPVYMTEPTLPLSVLLLEDLINVGEKSGAQYLPYKYEDIKTMIKHTVTLKYKQVTDISPDVKLTFFSAGHILGSAMVHLHITEGVLNVIFTGDFKYSPTKLFDQAYSSFQRAEILVMESTYGGKDDITNRSESEETLKKIINETVNEGGKVLIPVPAVGRAQEMLLVLEEFFRNNEIPDIPVFIDGMIEESNNIHTAYLDYLSNKIRRAIVDINYNPLQHDNVVPIHNTKDRDEAIYGGPCIILSTSGMMQGGPVLEYFKVLASDPKNRLIFVTYQVSGTLGRRIVDGAQSVAIQENGRYMPIKIEMKVHRLEGFTGHSDRRQLMAYIKKLHRLTNHIYLVHGEPEKSIDLALSAKRIFKTNIDILPLYSTTYLK